MPFPKDLIKKAEAIEKIRQKSLAQWKNPTTKERWLYVSVM